MISELLTGIFRGAVHVLFIASFALAWWAGVWWLVVPATLAMMVIGG